jgi:hypothetical protein
MGGIDKDENRRQRSMQLVFREQLAESWILLTARPGKKNYRTRNRIGEAKFRPGWM